MKYTFQCNFCQHKFDRDMSLQQTLNTAKNPKCPKCGHSTRKLINTPSIHFKGSGWGKDKKENE